MKKIIALCILGAMVGLSIYRSSTINIIDDGVYVYLDLKTEPLYKTLLNIGDEYDPNRTWWKNSQNNFRNLSENEYVEVRDNEVTFHTRFGKETVLIEDNTIPFWSNYYSITRGWLGGINLEAGLNTISLSKTNASYTQEKFQRVKNNMETYQQNRKLEVVEHQKQIANIDFSEPFDGLEQTFTINDVNYKTEIPEFLSKYSLNPSYNESRIKLEQLQIEEIEEERLTIRKGFDFPRDVVFDIITSKNRIDLTRAVPEGFIIYQESNGAIFFDSAHNLFSAYSIYDEQSDLSITAIVLIPDEDIDTAILMYKSAKTLRRSS
ncbi:MAG: hypothetical protein ACRCXK_08610 [Wohlfahrtiimonas sp.]